MTFEKWMERVDQVILDISGFSSQDLPDKAYWDMWNDGVSPREAGISVLEDENFPF